MKNLFKSVLMHLFCPEYRKMMPNDEAGDWMAVILRVTAFSRREIRAFKVHGLRAAYKVARWEALKFDVMDPSRCRDTGVGWAIRKPHENE